jgi:hypothetical protein
MEWMNRSLLWWLHVYTHTHTQDSGCKEKVISLSWYTYSFAEDLIRMSVAQAIWYQMVSGDMERDVERSSRSLIWCTRQHFCWSVSVSIVTTPQDLIPCRDNKYFSYIYKYSIQTGLRKTSSRFPLIFECSACYTFMFHQYQILITPVLF